MFREGSQTMLDFANLSAQMQENQTEIQTQEENAAPIKPYKKKDSCA